MEGFWTLSIDSPEMRPWGGAWAPATQRSRKSALFKVSGKVIQPKRGCAIITPVWIAAGGYTRFFPEVTSIA
ncbi:MAG: hypothetical protein SNJ52_00310 [Verrucomicrobiia bacterium]